MGFGRSSTFRAWFVGSLLLACVATVALSAWLFWPMVQDYNIRQAVLHYEQTTITPRWWPESWQQEWRVRTKLMEPVTIEFMETPLSDVRDFMQDYSGFEIRWNKAALEAEGITSDTPVTVHVEQVSLRTALRIMFDRLQMTFLINDGAFVLTTKLAADNDLNPRHNPAFRSYGIESLGNESVQIRREAAFALASDPPRKKTGRSALIAALRDEDREVRLNIAFALSEFGPDTLPALVQALDEDDRTVRWTISQAVRKIGADAVPILSRALKSDEPSMRSGASFAIGELGPDYPEMVPNLFEALRRKGAESENILNALKAYRGPAVAPAREMLTDSDPELRAMAVALLAILLEDALPVLLETTNDEDPTVRRVAANSIRNSRYHRRAAIVTLWEKTEDEDPFIRINAAEAILRIGGQDDEVLTKLRAELDNRDPRIRARVKTVMGMVESRKSTNPEPSR